jgi:heme exporter protein A
VLTLDRVSKFFGPRPVFRDVTLALAPGEALLLAGPNGAGKSTLLRIMAGLARPTTGKAQCSLPAEKIGYLGHATFIYPELSGLENLAFWARVYGLDADRDALLAALERMELDRSALDRAGRYSRGMAQRLSLARVFLTAPDLLLLDEPSTGLDTRSEGVLRREMAQARERGAAMVWISHNAARDKLLVDRVLELRDRKTAYLGPAEGYEPEAAC